MEIDASAALCRLEVKDKIGSSYCDGEDSDASAADGEGIGIEFRAQVLPIFSSLRDSASDNLYLATD